MNTLGPKACEALLRAFDYARRMSVEKKQSLVMVWLTNPFFSEEGRNSLVKAGLWRRRARSTGTSCGWCTFTLYEIERAIALEARLCLSR